MSKGIIQCIDSIIKGFVEPEKPGRKVIQITNTNVPGSASVVALCDDGSLYWTSSQGERWHKFKDVPQD